MGTMVAPWTRDISFLSAYSKRRVLVTGHTGFKGAWLAQQLLLAGADVMGYSLAPSEFGSHFERLGIQDRIRHVEGDIRDLSSLLLQINVFKPDIVFHLAAQALVRKSYENPRETFEINVLGGVNVLEAVRANDCIQALVFVTSDKCYENVEWVWGYRETDSLGGADPYSASKAAIEIVFSSYLRSFFTSRREIAVATVRAGNVIGGGDFSTDRIVPDLIRSFQCAKPLVLRNPTATRPWQHVLEPLSGYLKLGATLLSEGRTFSGPWNFGPPVTEARTVLEVAEGLASYFDGYGIEIDKCVTNLSEAHLLQLNSDKASIRLQWQTRWGFDKTLQETARWYRAVLLEGVPASLVTNEQIRDYYTENL